MSELTFNVALTGIPDTGASKHFLQPKTISSCAKITLLTSSPIQVTAADGGKMQATHKVQIPLSLNLSPKAQIGYILNGLSTGLLVSIGQLCDDDCIILFHKYYVKIIKNGKVIIEGKRDNNNKLWTIPLAPQPLVADSIIQNKKTKQDFM